MFDSVIVNGLTVFSVAFIMALFSILLRRKFVNQEQFQEWQQEVKRWNANKEQARKTGDKKLLAKLKKQEKRINQIQSKMMKGQSLTMFINMGIFFGVWQVLIFYFADKTVAYIPFSIPFLDVQPPYPLPFLVGGWPLWYIICSFFSSMLLQRLFGISMSMTMQPQTSK